jgi:peptidoglycan/LPS O-acetylase OafA/YrhL
MGEMNTKWLYYLAAGTTAIAGILHLILAPNMLNFNPSSAMLFFVGGAAQLFWVVPMIRRWGKVWYGIGIGGTLVLIAIWTITRIDGNPITGRGGMISEMGIAVETMQWAFVGLTAAILVMELRMKRIDKRTAIDTA